MTTLRRFQHNPWLVVALLWVVGALNYLDRVMITTMRGSLVAAIPMTEAQYGLLTTAFLAIYALLSPFAGYIADRFNRSVVIIVSLLAWSVITWLTAHAHTYGELLTTRFLMGISEAAYVPASLALVTDYHRDRTRSLANGILLGGVMVGSAAGGLGGWLAERHDWSYAFGVFGVVGIGFSVLLVLLLRDAPESMVAEPAAELRFTAALASLVTRGSFWIALLYWCLFSVAGWMSVGWMPTYLEEQFKLSQGTAGLIATISLNLSALVGLVAGGVWSDRWTRTRRHACILVAVIGLCVSAPGVLLASWTSVLWLAVAGLLVFGLASAFAIAETMPILCLIVDVRYRATAYGVLNLFACLTGGATIYAGGLIRDAKVNVNTLFLGGTACLLGCAGLLGVISWQLKARTSPVTAK